MNNSNELDQLVESFLQPKSVSALDLTGLFALFEEMKKDGFLLENTTSGKKFSQFIINAIPSKEFLLKDLEKGIQQQLFSEESKDRSLFFQNLQTSLDFVVEGEKSPLERLKKITQYVSNLQKTKAETTTLKSISSTFGSIIFIVSLFNMIETFNAQQAGVLFESFFAFLVGGRLPSGNPIGDVVVDFTSTKDLVEVSTTETWSLKLVNNKTEVKGSITNMFTYFGIDIEKMANASQDVDEIYQYLLVNYVAKTPEESKDNKNKVIYYLIANKGVSQIIFNAFSFDLNTFIKMLNQTNQLKRFLVTLKYKNDLSGIKIDFSKVDPSKYSNLLTVTDAKKAINALRNDTYLPEEEKPQDAEIKLRVAEEIMASVSQQNKSVTDYNPDYLQFYFDQKITGSKVVLPEPLVLKLTNKDLETIISNNMQKFANDINSIVDEMNNINYQIANYFLNPNERNGMYAFKAIKKLEDSFANVGAEIKQIRSQT